MSEEELIAAQRFCEDYKKFLDTSKIEYYGVKNAVAEAEKAGFVPFEYGKKYSAGDKIYHVQKGHAAVSTLLRRTLTAPDLTSNSALFTKTAVFAC